MDNAKTLVAAARLLLDVAETLMDSPNAPPTVRDDEVAAVHRRERPKPQALRTSKTGQAKHRGRPKGAKDYICLACSHGFRAVNPIQCPNPNCGAHDNFVLKKDFNSEDFPTA